MNYLFHYTTISKLKIILDKQTIMFNNIDKVNDPYEVKSIDYLEVISFQKFMSEFSERMKLLSCENFKEPENAELNEELDDWENVILEDEREYYYFILEQYNKLRKKIVKTLCFSCGISKINDLSVQEIPNKRPGYFYPRMWAQYANTNKGCCIIFNKNKFDAIFNKLSSHYHLFAGKISYIDILSNEYKDSIMKYISGMELNLNKIITYEYLLDNIRLLFFRKDINWRDEIEYRYLIVNKNNNIDHEPYLMNIENAIDYIVMGENSKYDKTLIKNIQKKGIKIYQINNILSKYILKNVDFKDMEYIEWMKKNSKHII